MENRTLEKLTTGIGAVVLAGVMIFIAATFGGTILWLIYPHIHSLFPNACADGIITKDLAWWDSVCITWMFGILFGKGYVKNSK